jgi:2-iminobutanoate/2-iminopropanoate deaminase
MSLERRRESINVKGLGHGELPIPTACRVDNIVMSGGISGHDPATGRLPESVEGQVRQMFANVRDVLAAAGATPADVVRMTCFVADPSYRAALNPAWSQMFPDELSRPARHTLPLALDGGRFVQCDVMAVVADRR